MQAAVFVILHKSRACPPILTERLSLSVCILKDI